MLGYQLKPFPFSRVICITSQACLSNSNGLNMRILLLTSKLNKQLKINYWKRNKRERLLGKRTSTLIPIFNSTELICCVSVALLNWSTGSRTRSFTQTHTHIEIEREHTRSDQFDRFHANHVIGYAIYSTTKSRKRKQSLLLQANFNIQVFESLAKAETKWPLSSTLV